MNEYQFEITYLNRGPILSSTRTILITVVCDDFNLAWKNAIDNASIKIINNYEELYKVRLISICSFTTNQSASSWITFYNY